MFYNNNDYDEVISFATRGEVMSEEELAVCIDDLEIDDEMYFLLGKNDKVVEIIGSPTLTGLMQLARVLQVFNLTDPSMMFKGRVIDHTSLPDDIINSNDFRLITILHDTEYDYHFSYKSMAAYIERKLKEYSDAGIDDFTVILAAPLNFDKAEWDSTEERSSYNGAC